MDNYQESTGTYYHYTDDNGAKGIAKERKIRPSTDPTDMMIGKGVYLTTKNPEEHTKEEILQNNYDSAPPSRNPDRVKHVVKITIPTSHVEKAKMSSRDVHKYKGEDELDLKKYPHKITQVDKQGRNQEKWPGVPGPLRLLFRLLLRHLDSLPLDSLPLDFLPLDFLLRFLEPLLRLLDSLLRLLLPSLPVGFVLTPFIFLFLTYFLYGRIFDSPDCSLPHSPRKIPPRLPVFYCSASGVCTTYEIRVDPANHKMPPVDWYKLCFCGLVSAFLLLSFWLAVFFLVRFRLGIPLNQALFNSSSSGTWGPDILYPIQDPLMDRHEFSVPPTAFDQFTATSMARFPSPNAISFNGSYVLGSVYGYSEGTRTNPL